MQPTAEHWVASHRTVAELASVNRAVAAGTARGQTTVEPIPAAAHEANREAVKVVVAAEVVEVVAAAMAATRGATGAAAEAALSWTQATDPLYRRDSQHRRSHHQVHRSGRDPYT